MADSTQGQSSSEVFASSRQQYPQDLLLFQISDVAVKITSHLRQLLASSGLTPTELRILALCLESESGTTASEIASRSIFRTAGVSRMVDNLVQMGLLERQGSSRDRRLSLLKPTGQAFELALGLCPLVEKLQDDVVASLGAEEVDTLKSWMTSLSNALDDVQIRDYV